MYLKSIEVHGFKSFANRIKLDFHNGITGIVGPNGSGKSNVADAVRWVLGEQRTKQLRGSSMQDVIFSGTEMRKPLGYAFVSITLDNTDHALAIDYDEVTVSRRLYRSGESEYMINGAGCRLKDVNELFYDTGIGKEGYSIIGQGQIDQILSSKPEDRRNLFDEAAGIVKFKVRKDAAIKKLESEKANLLRLNDILSEIENQIAPLEKQSETARIYLRDREQLKKLDVNLFLVESEQSRESLQKATADHETATADMERLRAQYEEVRRTHEEVSSAIETLDSDIEKAREEMTNSSVTKEKLEGQILLFKEQIRSATENERHFKDRRETLEGEIAAVEANLALLTQEKTKIDEEMTAFASRLKTAQETLDAVRADIAERTERIEEKQNEVLDTLNERAGVKSRLSSLTTMKEQAAIRRAELTSRLVRAQSDETAQEETIKKLREEFERISEEIEAHNATVKSAEEELAGIKGILTSCDEELRAAQAGYHGAKSQYDALLNLTERYEGYGGSVKRVMEEKEREKGIIGVVADIIRTKAKYETAIEVALGGALQNVVTKDEETAKRMIALLKKEKAGRATFLPLSGIKDTPPFREKDALNEKGVLGTADTLVETDKDYRDVAISLLSRIVVAETVDDALRLANKYRHSLRIVTLTGELLTPGGAISGGAFRKESNLLGRRRELDALQEEVKKFKKAEADAQKKIEDTKQHRNDLRASADKARTALQEKFIEQNTARMGVIREEEKQKETQEGYTNLQNESRDLEEQLKQIAKQEEEAEEALKASEETEKAANAVIEENQEALKGLTDKEKEAADEASHFEVETEKIRQKLGFEQENLDRVTEELSAKKRDLNEVEESIRAGSETLRQKQRDIDEINATIEASADVQSEARKTLEEKMKQKEELSARQKTFFADREALAEQTSSLDKEINRLETMKERLKEAIDNRINYMWDEYEITLSDAEEMKDDGLTDVSRMKREISSLKDAIKKLGDVNVNAIEDYRNLMERYTFLKTQHDDLVTAEEQLRGIIEELDNNMRTQFADQFEKIRVAFNDVFKEMFGGGVGALKLVDDEDILNAGILIDAQPPGKKLQNMMQLSGGEKALTAIALLFAIQRLKPSPFCLLDEIEAALDENNVVRFARYLHKLKETQFIVITHRRGTMESADRLYGITMQEKGISALVSVNLIDKDLED